MEVTIEEVAIGMFIFWCTAEIILFIFEGDDG